MMAEGHRLGACIWVKPGMMVAAWASAWAMQRPLQRHQALLRRGSQASRTHSRKSVTT